MVAVTIVFDVVYMYSYHLSDDEMSCWIDEYKITFICSLVALTRPKIKQDFHDVLCVLRGFKVIHMVELGLTNVTKLQIE